MSNFDRNTRQYRPTRPTSFLRRLPWAGWSGDPAQLGGCRPLLAMGLGGLGALGTAGYEMTRGILVRQATADECLQTVGQWRVVRRTSTTCGSLFKRGQLPAR